MSKDKPVWLCLMTMLTYTVWVLHYSNCTNKNILAAIDKAVSSSMELRSKKEPNQQGV